MKKSSKKSLVWIEHQRLTKRVKLNFCLNDLIILARLATAVVLETSLFLHTPARKGYGSGATTEQLTGVTSNLLLLKSSIISSALLTAAYWEMLGLQLLPALLMLN